MHHSGDSYNSGHYTATVRTDQGWFCADDKNVTPLVPGRELEKHLQKDAYMAFYVFDKAIAIKEMTVVSHNNAQTNELRCIIARFLPFSTLTSLTVAAMLHPGQVVSCAMARCMNVESGMPPAFPDRKAADNANK